MLYNKIQGMSDFVTKIVRKWDKNREQIYLHRLRIMYISDNWKKKKNILNTNVSTNQSFIDKIRVYENEIRKIELAKIFSNKTKCLHLEGKECLDTVNVLVPKGGLPSIMCTK